MTIRLNFERSTSEETQIQVTLTPEINEETCPVEKAWGKRALGYAQKVSEKHTFEFNQLREDQPCTISLKSGDGNAIYISYKAPEADGVIGGLTSSTLAMSSIVFAMLSEAVQANGEPFEYEDEDEYEYENEDEDEYEDEDGHFY